MLHFRKLTFAKKLFAVLLVVVVSFSIAFASNLVLKQNKSECFGFWWQRTTWYTDANHTTSVGQRIWFCDGESGAWGTTSQFPVVENCDCIE
jgi:hypothetical protein